MIRFIALLSLPFLVLPFVGSSQSEQNQNPDSIQMIPIVGLHSDFDEALERFGEPVESERDESYAFAQQHTFEIDLGHIILTEWQGKVHQVIYWIYFQDEQLTEQKYKYLLDLYADGATWNRVLDNGFGYTYVRSDQKQYALYSYWADVSTFTTAEIKEELGKREKD